MMDVYLNAAIFLIVAAVLYFGTAFYGFTVGYNQALKDIARKEREAEKERTRANFIDL